MLIMIINGFALVVALTTLFLQRKIMATQKEAAAQLTAIAAQVAKVKEEVQKLIDTAGNETDISDELQAAIDSVAAAVTGVDDMNPDGTPATPV